MSSEDSNEDDRPYTSCEEYGHKYSFEGDDEVFGQCLDCGEKRVE
jgi:hypothetical protein